MIPLSLIAACSPPDVAPQTVAAIIRVESAGDPLSLHVNPRRGVGFVIVPPDAAAGLAMAERAIRQGSSVDIGLMQVNSRNVARLDYTLAQMFDPCTNIGAGARILSEDYRSALAVAPPGQKALQAALSAYNTGNFQAGFRNGYVGHYYNVSSVSSSAAPDPLTVSTSVFHRSTDDDTFGTEKPIAIPQHWPGAGG